MEVPFLPAGDSGGLTELLSRDELPKSLSWALRALPGRLPSSFRLYPWIILGLTKFVYTGPFCLKSFKSSLLKLLGNVLHLLITVTSSDFSSSSSSPSLFKKS